LQVLGNVQKRRMYDKGGLYETGTADMSETTEQAGVSKFYKSRGQIYTGKTPGEVYWAMKALDFVSENKPHIFAPQQNIIFL